MKVVGVWIGSFACTLQTALRMTNEQFADHLGVAVRTVSTWHANPNVVPRTEMQQVLDRAFAKATPETRERFALLVQEAGIRTPAAGPGEPLRVAIAIVVRGEEVLLVRRRGDDAAGITWQFPAGVIKPGTRPETATVSETLNETGVHCAVREDLGERLHPVTDVHCLYFLCDYQAGKATNRDVVENVDVSWVPKTSLTRFIPTDTIYPPILAALEEQ
ncbi:MULTISPECIES: NUDIX hydrolase [Streptomyces]|uniref:NUDIX hydrolase n=1 Tax=Streptomyces TaxID=1883 RepID=UPI00345BF999